VSKLVLLLYAFEVVVSTLCCFYGLSPTNSGLIVLSMLDLREATKLGQVCGCQAISVVKSSLWLRFGVKIAVDVSYVFG